MLMFGVDGCGRSTHELTVSILKSLVASLATGACVENCLRQTYSKRFISLSLQRQVLTIHDSLALYQRESSREEN